MGMSLSSFRENFSNLLKTYIKFSPKESSRYRVNFPDIYPDFQLEPEVAIISLGVYEQEMSSDLAVPSGVTWPPTWEMMETATRCISEVLGDILNHHIDNIIFNP